jgi:hypothetical protein
MVIAVPALQVVVSGDEVTTVPEPNAAGLGVQVRKGVTADCYYQQWQYWRELLHMLGRFQKQHAGVWLYLQQKAEE